MIAVGLLALGANELRLALHDIGLTVALATFVGALTLGLAATALQRLLDEPRVAITVPSIIVMVPGLYAFEMIELLYQGHTLEALQAAASCGFIIGAMAFGLTAARTLSER